MSDPAASGTDGLAQLRATIERGTRAPIGELMDFRLVSVEHGVATLEGTPGARHDNPLGTVHGGYAATLLDSACGLAVHTRLAADQGYATLELKVAFHRALGADSGLVRAEGKVVTMGRTVAFTEARLVDGEGRLCASATSTLMIVPRRGA